MDGKVKRWPRFHIGVDTEQTGRAEIFDPSTNQFTLLESTLALPARTWPGVEVLDDGSVLIMGGVIDWAASPDLGTDSVEEFDPVTGQFKETGKLKGIRGQNIVDFTHTKLANGTIFITGYSPNGITTEIYDPVLGESTVAVDLGYPACLGGAQFAKGLENGDVFLWGRHAMDQIANIKKGMGSCNTFRIDANGVVNTNAVMLHDEQIFAAGGTDGGGHEPIRAHGRTILINPNTFEVRSAGELVVPRGRPFLLVLHNGTVLAAGGHTYGEQPPAVEIELYDPLTDQFSVIGHYPPLQNTRRAVQLDDERILLFGFSGTGDQSNPSHAAIGDCVYGD